MPGTQTKIVHKVFPSEVMETGRFKIERKEFFFLTGFVISARKNITNGIRNMGSDSIFAFE